MINILRQTVYRKLTALKESPHRCHTRFTSRHSSDNPDNHIVNEIMGKNTNRKKINHCTLTFSLFDLYKIRKYIAVCNFKADVASVYTMQQLAT